MATTGTLRHKWQDLFLLAGQPTYDASKTCDFKSSPAAYYGSAGTTNFAWPLINTPTFDVGQEMYSTEQNYGFSERGYYHGGFEDLAMRKLATTSYEWHATALDLAVPLRGLFHSGMTETSSGAFPKTYIPPISARTTNNAGYPTFFLYLCDYMGSADNICIDGAIVTSITLSSDGGPITANATFQGRSLTVDRTLSSASTTFAATVPLLFENSIVSLGASVMDCAGFSVTISCNPIWRHYNNLLAHRAILGKYTVEGTFKVPYDETATGFASGTTVLNNWITSLIPTIALFEIHWGSKVGTTAGDFYMAIPALPSGNPTLTGDDEKMWEVPFKGVYNGSTSAPSVKFVLADGVNTDR